MKPISADKNVYAALINEPARHILRKIARNKQVRLPELAEEGVNPQDLAHALGLLKKAQLVDGTEGLSPSLSTYYVTASGLKASRELNEY